MRTSIKWLKDYVEFSQTPEELADLLTMAGVPVETIEYPGKDVENVVTGKILSVTHHPDADRLVVCKLDIGSDKPLTIVTGATNVQSGQIVPVAIDGARLPKGEIHTTLFRGIQSEGMLCSADELFSDTKIIPVDAKDGIYILPPDTPIGVDAKAVLGLDDVILEFELTANRADCFSVLGLAREISVLTGSPLKKPMLNLKEAGTDKAASLAKISIEAADLCSRFAARILSKVKVGPSPVWMQQRIQAAGMRPINNVVDVTNFVMLELGQPMHAYDYNLISRHSLIVRRAQPGEKLTTLDEAQRELSPQMLVIADAVQAVGIAGVMGGLATEVAGSTQTILLEAAAFNGPNIRRTSRALGLRSEASGRFERGVDIANITRALDRAAKLLEDMGACVVCPGIIDNYPNVVLPKQVVFTAEQVNRRLGTEITRAQMLELLKRLEFEAQVQGNEITVTVPTWRGDVTGMADISEEIARLYGFDRIPSTTPQGGVRQGGQAFSRDAASLVRSQLTGAGFDEIISFSFSHPGVFDKLNLPQDSPLRQPIPVMNPITDDFPILRTTLFGGILDTVVRNVTRKNEDMKIYEIGPVYWSDQLPLTELPKEPVFLCGAMTGKRCDTSWNQSKDSVDFYDAKGAVEGVLQSLGIRDYLVKAGEHPSLHPGKTAVIEKDGDCLAIVGEAHPRVLAAFGLNRRVCLFQVDMDLVVKHTQLISSFQPLPKFPAISRDLAVVLPDDIPSSAVASAISQSGGELLADVSLFDVYAGNPIPDGFRSLAFSLTFRHAERTLTDEAVAQDYDQIVKFLEKHFAAKLRD